MLVGTYEWDVTPPLGVNIPGYFEVRPAAGVRDRLYARALACSTEQGESFILISIDACECSPFCVARARQRIEEMLGIPGERVMMSVTHTHTGGPIDDIVPGSIDMDYIYWLGERAADAAVMAWNSRRPARIGFGRGHEDSIAFIRRYFMKDGTLKTNPGFCPDQIDRPAGEIDPEVGVVKIEDADGRLMAVITNYGCHPDTVSGNRFCADYPGELSRVLKAVYGQQVVSFFLNGACGNINHVDFMHRTAEYYAKANPLHYVRMGRILAGMVIRTLADIETKEVCSLSVESESFPAVIRTPDEKDIREAKELLEREPYEICYRTEEGSTGNRKNLQARSCARSLLEVAELKERNVSVPVQTARIGEIAIVGCPCELFVEFGKDIKRRSPFEHTLISTLTNAHFGYIADREAFALGGYETRITAVTMMAPETGYDLTDTAVRLLKKMHHC